MNPSWSAFQSRAVSN